MSYITRTTSVSVVPDGEPLFSESATNISIVDEAAGEFLEIAQPGDRDCETNPTPAEGGET